MHVHKGTVYPSTDRCPHCWRLSMIDLEKAQAEVKRLETENELATKAYEQLRTSHVALEQENERLKAQIQELQDHRNRSWAQSDEAIPSSVHEALTGQLTIAREALRWYAALDGNMGAGGKRARAALEQMNG